MNWIRTENDVYINAKHIRRVYVAEPRDESNKWRVVAELEGGNCTTVLFRCLTVSEAKRRMNSLMYKLSGEV